MRNDRYYEVAIEAEPINLFFETTFHIATGLAYPEYCAYFLATEEEQENVSLRPAGRLSECLLNVGF